MKYTDVITHLELYSGFNKAFLGTYYFLTEGTGIPDKAAIKFFKYDNSVIVIDRKNRMWRKGKKNKTGGLTCANNN